MQQKQTLSPVKLLLVGLGFLLAAGSITLMVMDIPAPQTAIEQPLDAKNFIGSK